MDWRRRLEEKQISEVRAGGSRFYPDWIFEQQKQGAAVGKSKNKVKAGHGTKPLDSLDVRLITYQLDGGTKLYNFTFLLCCSWSRYIINYFWALADFKVFFICFGTLKPRQPSLKSARQKSETSKLSESIDETLFLPLMILHSYNILLLLCRDI